MTFTDPVSQIKVSSNGSEAGNHAVTIFAQVFREAAEAKTKWIAEIRSRGIKAAHPDDGWVDRKENTVHFAYSHFDDGVRAEDKIALGQPDKFRVVTIIGKINGPFLERWKFK